ncbi:hypothetical protein [Poseidonocella sp. HB161398]|uniref:hypothetical protein n=1 Tax=Poseidonocella sp. HB161398 TaxID=2320855 RepID=UPI001109FFEA|nr:hypothetical protein [Poseidonocella sp. HB161398]
MAAKLTATGFGAAEIPACLARPARELALRPLAPACPQIEMQLPWRRDAVARAPGALLATLGLPR